MTTTQPVQRLTLPGTAKGGWKIDVAAIRAAIEFFSLDQPVEIVLSGGTRRKGCARYRNGAHSITVSTYTSAAQASKTIWHELTHAAQREYLGDEAFRAAYAAETRLRGGGRIGYVLNRFEVEARETADLMTSPLTKSA